MSAFDPRSPFSLPPVVKNIIIINIIVFVAAQLFDYVLHSDFMIRHFALFSIRSPYFEPHQVVTHMFMHANLAHIFFNMFGVFMFGRILEGVWGSKRMLIFYTVAGLGAAFVQLSVNYIQMSRMLSMANQFDLTPSFSLFNDFVNKYAIKGAPGYSDAMNFLQSWFYMPDGKNFIPGAHEIVSSIAGQNLSIPTVGASGAVFGLLIAFGMMFPNVELMLIFLPIPIKAKYFVPGYALLELFFGVAGFKGDNIAHFAHLGGALFGFIMVMIWRQNRFKTY